MVFIHIIIIPKWNKLSYIGYVNYRIYIDESEPTIIILR